MAPGGAALKEVGKGAGILLLGSFLGTALQFVGGVIVVRCLMRSEYGLYALAFSVVQVAAMVALLGFGNGVPQMLSGFVARGEQGRAWGVVLSSVALVAAASSTIGGLLAWRAGAIARLVGVSEIAPVLRVVAALVPALAGIQLGPALFRGLKKSVPKVIFGEVTPRVLKIAALVVVVVAGATLGRVVWATVVSSYVALLLLVLYSMRRLPKVLPVHRPRWMVGALLTFSAPLLGLAGINLVKKQASTLLVGYFANPDAVALFSAPQRLERFVELPLMAMVFMYLPVATTFARRGENVELRELYCSTTKWIALMTLPILLFCLFDARFLVEGVFGARYGPSAVVLQVLVAGTFVHSFLGPNGMTMLALGRRFPLVVASGVGAILNVVAGAVLIARYSYLGGAVAVSGAMAISNVWISVALFRKSGVHPFRHGYLWLVAVPATVGSVLYWVTDVAASPHLVPHVAVFMAMVPVCVFSPFVLRRVDENDVELLEAMERKLMRRAHWVRRLAVFCRCPVRNAGDV